jgi:hypothetical protein
VRSRLQHEHAAQGFLVGCVARSEAAALAQAENRPYLYNTVAKGLAADTARR